MCLVRDAEFDEVEHPGFQQIAAGISDRVMIDEIREHDLIKGSKLTLFGQDGEQVGVTGVA